MRNSDSAAKFRAHCAVTSRPSGHGRPNTRVSKRCRQSGEFRSSARVGSMLTCFLATRVGSLSGAGVCAGITSGIVLARQIVVKEPLLVALGLLGASSLPLHPPSRKLTRCQRRVERAPFFALCTAAVFAPAWTSLRSLPNSRVPHAGRSPPSLSRIKQRNLASVGLLIAMLFLLVTSAWFIFDRLRTPEYLYPAPPVTELRSYANRLPGWCWPLPDSTRS
jgi:hypothetical protein